MLFTIGLVFMAVARSTTCMGSTQQFVKMPAWLQGRVEVLGVGIGGYRLFIIVVCGVVTLALQLVLMQTRFGSRLRAAVDDQRVARGLGINVNAVFAVTFAVGSGLAGLGGALGAEILGLDPNFPLKYMIYFLIVVTVGGTSSITGPFLASLLLGIGRRRGQVLRARSSAASSSTRIMIAVLICVRRACSRGRRRDDEMRTRSHGCAASRARRAGAGSRSRSGSSPLPRLLLLPGKHLILTEIAILALFALSLDLILGYAGIVSLGHAAFFGFGGYAAGSSPSTSLARAGARARRRRSPPRVLGFATSFLVLRGTDLTRLMVTLGVALVLRELANRFAGITGGADGLQGITMAPVLGMFEFDLYGHTAYVYSLAVLFLLFVIARRIVHSPFGLSLRAIKGNPLRASAIGIPVDRAPGRDLHGRGFLRRRGGRAARADDRVRLARRARLPSLGRPAARADHRRRRLPVRRVDRRGRSSSSCRTGSSDITPQYWQFWLGLMLVVIVLVGRERMARWRGCRAHARQAAHGRAMTPALETRGLSKSFGGIVATNDVSLRSSTARATR